jgi:hypothetical protein
MTDVVALLWIIVSLLALILLNVYSIGKRLKEQLPTAKEEDYQWSQNDPAGHMEAHKDDRKKGK